MAPGMESSAVRFGQVFVHSQETHLLLGLQGPLAAGHSDVLGEVLLQAVIVSPGARSLHKMKCRAIALQIKTSEEVDGNHVSSK